MDVVWDGIMHPTCSTNGHRPLALLLQMPPEHTTGREFLNSSPSRTTDSSIAVVRAGSRFFAPLHQAAHAGASVEVVGRLIRLGAWRTLQNARGERPVDVAERRWIYHLREILEPVLKRRVPLGVLLKIQFHFHEVIRARMAEYCRLEIGKPNYCLRLPELESLLELDCPNIWFTVPGMYGGFGYSLETDGVEAKLGSSSWCRVAGGSGQRHEITSEGSRLIAEGLSEGRIERGRDESGA